VDAGRGAFAAVSALELRDVVKHYRVGKAVVKAVDGVSLTISPGEFVALYGPSGSGKTTLLELAAGIFAPDAGSILFGGRDISKLSGRERALYRRRDVGLVSQSPSLMATSAVNNAGSKLVPDGFSFREARPRARPWLERVGLGARLEHDPEQLSMGERQRVAIARALTCEPTLLLADEPTGNLDSERSREILRLLRDACHERDIPGLIVTHDERATDFVDSVQTLTDGRLRDGSDGLLAPRP
jgi:putative ABC transport system ATP-binding protein